MRHITHDNDGFLWISTFNGCVRFDGNRFKIFDSSNIPFLSVSAFYHALPDNEGGLYLSTQEDGLIYYLNGKFSKVFENTEIPKNIRLSYLDKNNRLWIGTFDEGIFYVENGKVARYSIPEFKGIIIQDFAEGPQGELWVATIGSGVAKITEKGHEIYSQTDGLASNVVNTLTYHNGLLYAGGEKGLSIFSDGNWNVDSRFRDKDVNDIVLDSENSLWFATNIGIGRLSNKHDFQFIGEEDGIPSRQVYSIAIDEEKNVWFTTKRGGLVQLKLSSFKNITTKEGLSYKSINVISEAPDGRIFIGSDRGDVDIVNDNEISRVELETDLNNVQIKDILFDENQTIWIATYKGLIKKTPTNEILYTQRTGLLSDKSRRITKHSDGTIWVGSRSGGIDKFYVDGKHKSISTEDGLSSSFVFCMEEAPDGRMVVGTANGGINIIDTNGEIEVFAPDSISGLSIFNINIESNTRMWLATNIGLFCFENETFHLINFEQGLQTETLFDVIEDSDGYLWMTSILGMVRLNKQEALDFVHGKTNKVFSTLYDHSDGMVTRECTGATRSLLDKNGNIWIPTIKGVSVLKPKEVIVNTKLPPVFIEEILIDDVPYNDQPCCRAGSKVVIEPGHRNYTINFTSLSMYSPEKVVFKHKLEGFDEDWVEVGPDRQAKYTNIPYGKYTFKVMAANNNGVWSDKPAELDMVIEPYFYETRSFIILIIIFFIGITILIYNLQTRAVQSRNKELIKLNNELDAFAYSVSHDLKAPLTSIQGLLNVARLEEGKNALHYYKNIEHSVEKLNNFIKDIIDYSKNSRIDVVKENVNVKKEVEELIEGLTYLIEENRIKSYVNVEKDLNIDIDKTRFIFILNNLLTNAFRYADLAKKEPYVKISISIKGKTLTITVEDNGQGIKKEYHTRVFEMFYRANEGSSGSGLGLYIVKESVDILGGKLKLESEYEKGTTVTVTLPV